MDDSSNSFLFYRNFFWVVLQPNLLFSVTEPNQKIMIGLNKNTKVLNTCAQVTIVWWSKKKNENGPGTVLSVFNLSPTSKAYVCIFRIYGKWSWSTSFCLFPRSFSEADFQKMTTFQKEVGNKQNKGGLLQFL